MAVLASVFWLLTSEPAAAGEFRKGDLVTFKVACRAAEPVEAWAERWARADPDAGAILAGAIQGGACFLFSWPQNGALLAPAGPVHRDGAGRGRQVWRLYAFHQAVFVAFDPEGGPHAPAKPAEAPRMEGQGS